MTTATADRSELFIRQWCTDGTLPTPTATWGEILKFTAEAYNPTWVPDPAVKKQLTADVEQLIMKTYAKLGCRKPREVKPAIYTQALYDTGYTRVIGVRYIDVRLEYKPYKAQLHRAYSGFSLTNAYFFENGPIENTGQLAEWSSPVIAFAAVFVRKERNMTYVDAYRLLAEQPEAAEYKV